MKTKTAQAPKSIPPNRRTLSRRVTLLQPMTQRRPIKRKLSSSK